MRSSAENGQCPVRRPRSLRRVRALRDMGCHRRSRRLSSWSPSSPMLNSGSIPSGEEGATAGGPSSQQLPSPPRTLRMHPAGRPPRRRRPQAAMTLPTAARAGPVLEAAGARRHRPDRRGGQRRCGAHPRRGHPAAARAARDGHRLHWEVSGHPRGTPAVVLHGGPGGGCTPGLRRLFDPARHRIVCFDQRNAGRSLPSAADPVVDLSANTTAHLIADIERLREHLEVDRWLVWGGSWGVTLGLAYAQTFPDRVTALVLGAVTAGTRREIDWITRDMGRVFPREWERFRDAVPAADRDGDLAAAYSRRLHHPDPAVRAAAAQAWCDGEDPHVSLAPDAQPRLSIADPAFQLAFARLVTHYWAHDCFLADRQLLGQRRPAGGHPGSARRLGPAKPGRWSQVSRGQAGFVDEVVHGGLVVVAGGAQPSVGGVGELGESAA